MNQVKTGCQDFSGSPFCYSGNEHGEVCIEEVLISDKRKSMVYAVVLSNLRRK